jgi:hypothetical protein
MSQMAIARGELATVIGDLSRPIGRPSADLSTAVKQSWPGHWAMTRQLPNEPSDVRSGCQP